MSATQTNTQPGKRVLMAAIALLGMEGRLVKVVDGGSEAKVRLPESASDLALLLLTEGAAQDEAAEVISVLTEGNRRVRLNGTVAAGVPLVLCDPTAAAGANAGKVEALPATAGLYFSPGIAEEDGEDEQLVLFRPLPRLIQVAATFTGATPAATGASNAAPYGFTTQAQADALVATVREMRAALTSQGLMKPNA